MRRLSLLLVIAAGCQFSFDRELGPGELRGMVVFESTSGSFTPTTNARVVLENSTIAVTTDAKGHFVIRGLRPGECAINITASRSRSGRADSGIRLRNLRITDEGGGKPGALDLGRIVISGFGDLNGTVDYQGIRLTGPTAVIQGVSQKSAVDGFFSFTNLLPGEYDVSVLASIEGQSRVVTQTIEVAPRKVTTLAPIHFEDAPVVTEGALDGSVHLTGVDSSAGVDVSLSSATAVASELPPLVTAGTDGTFSAEGLQVGVYTVTASVDGYAPVTVGSVFVGDSTSVPTLTLIPASGTGPSTTVQADVPTREERIQQGCENLALCGSLAPFVSVDDCNQHLTDVVAELDAQPICRSTAEDLVSVADCFAASSCGAFQNIACVAPQILFALEAAKADICASSADPFLARVLGDGRAPGERGLPTVLPATVSTLSGNGSPGFYEGTGGPFGSARLSAPSGLALDPRGFVYVADRENHRIRRADVWGNLMTIAGDGFPGSMDGLASRNSGAEFAYPTGLAIDARLNIYVADSANNRIRKIGADGVVTTVAGTGVPGFADGNGGSQGRAQFNGPTSLAVDSGGNVFVADAYNNRIRRIDSTGAVTTVAGNGMPAFADGPNQDAAFFRPTGIALDSAGNLFVADQGNHRIRRIDHTTAEVTTVAGAGRPGDDEGAIQTALFSSPSGVAVASNGALYVADTGNHKVRRILDGVVDTVAGSEEGFNDGTTGPIGTAQMKEPFALVVDPRGLLFVADRADNRIRIVRP